MRGKVDVVTCDYYHDSTPNKMIYNNDQDLLKGVIANRIIIFCFNALYRHDFITNHKISFDPIWLSYTEDKLFNIRVLAAGAHYEHISKPLYHYCSRKGSCTNKSTKKNYISLKRVIEETEKIIPCYMKDDLFGLKKWAIYYAYNLHLFDEVAYIYPEIHERIAKERNSDYWSLDSQLARCMNQPPFIVWLIAKTHQYFKKITMQL